MTAFSLVMLGKLVFLVVFCCYCVFTSETSVFCLVLIYFFNFFRLLHQMSTRCSSAKALSFWREERSHLPSDVSMITD